MHAVVDKTKHMYYATRICMTRQATRLLTRGDRLFCEKGSLPMSLDLTSLGKQVRQMSNELALGTSNRKERIAQIRTFYINQTGTETHTAEKVGLSHETATWLLARPVEPFDVVRHASLCPATYALVATDGSQIELDRHGIADCYVINTGHVYLRYGANPVARLSSQPTIYYREEDLYIRDGARLIIIDGSYLNTRRDVQELEALVALSEAHMQDDDDTPVLALQDGTLIRFALAGAEKVVQQRFLDPYLGGLEKMRMRGIPVASYISRSRANELVGTIRLMYCPDIDVDQHQGARCTHCSDMHAERVPSCHICNGLVDADILYERLREGQRGPIFETMSRVNEKYGHHSIRFFYMRVGREIARVEVPKWVADNAAQVDLVHSIIYDQCSRGQGYPVALSRAHEQAVVRSAERYAFERILEGSFVRAELPATNSLKQESKEFNRV